MITTLLHLTLAFLLLGVLFCGTALAVTMLWKEVPAAVLSWMSALWQIGPWMLYGAMVTGLSAVVVATLNQVIA